MTKISDKRLREIFENAKKEIAISLDTTLCEGGHKIYSGRDCAYCGSGSLDYCGRPLIVAHSREIIALVDELLEARGK